MKDSHAEKTYTLAKRMAAMVFFGFFFWLIVPTSFAANDDYYYSLSATKPYIKTIHVRAGETVLIRRWGTTPIYPPDRTIPWVNPSGDPGCIASEAYTLPGVNCWSLVARFGNHDPFLVNNEWYGKATTDGYLYIGINHAPPFTAGGSWYIQILHSPSVTTPPPTPFLQVPWMYDPSRTFEDVILKINSYFDHEYPLLSTSLSEPADANNNLTNYRGIQRSDDYRYSSHDGYDFGRDAGASISTPVLAAAPGCASYSYCDACGHRILIDHGNHYQTRYMHLQEEGLITTSSQCVEVDQGDQIGLVGFSGRVIPEGEGGAHLHFMVVEDKNRDGNFNDNIPDGLTDPFGWQSEHPDPWENYTFSYSGAERTGNKSFYLWQENVSNLDQNLPTNGGVFNHKQLELAIAPGSVIEKATVFIQAQPFQFILDNIFPVGSIMEIVVKNLFGTPITLLSEPATLTFSFADEDLSNADMQQALIYSSSDGITWAPHETTIDLEAKTAQASTTHFSYFTLAAPQLDTVPPETKLVFDQEPLGDGTDYPLPLQLMLEATDASPSAGEGHTFYRLNDEEWQLFTQPIEITQIGDYIVHYYSTDVVENIESFKSASFSVVDAPVEPPEITITLDSDFQTFISSPVSQATIDQQQLSKFTEQITAQAGEANTKLTLKKGKILGIETWQFKTLGYNQDDSQSLPNNLYTLTKVRGKKNSYAGIIQSWHIGKQGVLLTYDVARKRTTVIELLNNRPRSTKTYPGFRPLNLSTQSGTIVYSY